MEIIAYTIDRETGICNSLGEHKTEPSYLEFLLHPYKETIKVFSHLDADVARLLALIDLTPKELEKLAKTGGIYINTNEATLPYIIRYIPGKWFSIDKGYGKGHLYAGFSDMSQYKEPNDFSLSTRAKAAQYVGEQVYQAFVELGFSPKNLISPTNVYRKEVIDKLDLPSCDDVPIEALEIAYECCKGSWVEAFQIGAWDKVYDYDINSAYPYWASLLLDLRQGEWRQSSKYQKEANYGYCRCEVMIDTDFSPILLSLDENSYTPKGVFETSLTKKQIDFINHWNLGYATILDGWWWFGNGVNILPLDAEIKKLYKEKQGSTGIKKGIIKRIMAGSFYGLWLETRGGEFGEHFLSPWSAEIETRTQLQIAETCLRNKVVPLHVAVDGIITDKPIDLGDDYTQDIEMGNWRLEHYGKCIIASSGLASIDAKNGTGDFSVKYDWLNWEIGNNPKARSYQMKKQSVLTLAQARNQRRLMDVGKTEEITRTVSFGDNKRLYEKMPKNFGELAQEQYRSEAWTADMLKILEGEEENEKV